MARDFILSLVRTYVPIGVGVLVAWLAAKGVVVDADTSAALVLAIGGLASAAYYALARFLELKFPLLGGLLLGAPRSTPVYVKNLKPTRHTSESEERPEAPPAF